MTATASWGTVQAQGIHIELAGQAGEVRRGMRITGNTITSFADAAIQISTEDTAQQIDGLEISDNEISAGSPSPTDLTAIRFAQPGRGTDLWLGRPLVTDNRIADDVKVKVQRDGLTVPFLVLSGNLGATAIFEGDGTPEQVLPAPPGCLFLSVSDPAGATVYLKTSGTGPTGWAQLATVP